MQAFPGGGAHYRLHSPLVWNIFFTNLQNTEHLVKAFSNRDLQLLRALQRNAEYSQHQLADLADMSRTSCWRRIKDFEEAGLIERRVALLNPRLAGFQIRVLLAVALVEHSDENRLSFEAHVASLPEVTECFSTSGERDYVLQIVAEDMEAYDDFLNERILKHRAVQSATSTFVLRQVKYTTELPL